MTLSRADELFIEEIIEGLNGKFGVKKTEAKNMVFKSSFLRTLREFPEQAHHDTPNSWARTIAKQAKLKEVSI